MFRILSFALLFAVLNWGQIDSAQNIKPGKCPEVKLMTKFDWPTYMGVWYEYARIENFVEFGQSCSYSNYTLKDDTVVYKNSALNLFHQPTYAYAIGKILGPGRWYATFKSGLKGTHIILDTDYKTWTAAYSCIDRGSQHAEYAWIFTRERNLNEDALDKVMAVYKANGISTELLKKIKQDGCPAHMEKGNTKTNLLSSLKNWLFH